MPPFININGYPGVGKLTVAKELYKLFPKAKVVSNHLLIDPAAAVFDRPWEALKSIATAKSTSDGTWIFTDQQSSDKLGSSSSRDYQNTAAVRGSLFISIILHCDLDKNLERAAGADRGNGSNTKLTDLNILRGIRETEDIFHFKDEYEMELDVTHLSPIEAAGKIHDHIGKVVHNDSAGSKMDA